MSKVIRSPNYPIISLPEAVARVLAIYEKERKHAVPKDSVARAIGYSGMNGASGSVLSALMKYGLLEAAGGDQLKVSAGAIDIILRESGERERAEAIRAAALRPALFSELHALYGDDLPSDVSLGMALQRRGFTPKAVPGVIRSYRDTMDFVKAESASSDADIPSEEPQVDVMPRSRVPSQPPVSGLALSTTGRADTGLRVSAAPVQQPPAVDNGANLSFNLAQDCGAKIFFSGRVTQEAIHKLIALLNLSVDTFPSKEQRTQQVQVVGAAEEPETISLEDLEAGLEAGM